MINYKKYHRDKTYEENESHFNNIFMTRYVIARRFKKNPGRVLDIGASTGVMLDIFKEHGWETWGVEPSTSALRAEEKSHKMLKIYFEEAKLPNNYFDLVVMNHTLEHVNDADLVMNKIYKLLNKDGIVLIDVPNAGGFGSRVMGERWPYRLPLEHIYQFTKISLSRIFTNAGFKVIYFRSRSGMFEFNNPIAEIWEALTTGKKRFFTDLINLPYDMLVTALNKGDSMTIVGRKL